MRLRRRASAWARTTRSDFLVEQLFRVRFVLSVKVLVYRYWAALGFGVNSNPNLRLVHNKASNESVSTVY